MICIPFIFVIILFSDAPLLADSLKEVLNEAEQLNLANDPTWLKLIHYDSKKKQSVVLTESFFLSANGKICPKSELVATIKAYFAPKSNNSDESACCRFPARYYWLSSKLSSFNYDLNKINCKRLKEWGLYNSVKSISLFLVSGYFGNPASTFGHALIKLNSESKEDEFCLFDSTLNYGAMVPDNENAFLYVARGLFGGYKAGFSDKYFYTEDLVYSRSEFRDIWDYKLNLSEFERTLLILHIWEIVGHKFKYFFLDKNCAFRLAELVDLVVPEEVLNNYYAWYLPEELFYSLKGIDKKRSELSRAKFIKSVTFIPSSQRKLFHQLKLLKPNELSVFNYIVKEGIDSLPKHLAKLNSSRQIFVLDSLLAYQHYKLVAKDPNANRDRVKFKDKILLARLRLPPKPSVKPKIPELPSPADGSRPMVFGASFATEKSEENFLRLTWSPFKKETIGQNSLEGDELVVFDLAAGLYRNRNKVFIDKFDLIRIYNFNTLSVEIMDENLWSWKLRVGLDRIRKSKKNNYDGLFSFGAGQSWKLSKAFLSYAMIDFSGHTVESNFRLRPHLGIRYDIRNFKILFFEGAESEGYDGEFRNIWGGKAQYQLNDQWSLDTELSNEKATRFSVGLNRYW